MPMVSIAIGLKPVMRLVVVRLHPWLLLVYWVGLSRLLICEFKINKIMLMLIIPCNGMVKAVASPITNSILAKPIMLRRPMRHNTVAIGYSLAVSGWRFLKPITMDTIVTVLRPVMRTVAVISAATVMPPYSRCQRCPVWFKCLKSAKAPLLPP